MLSEIFENGSGEGVTAARTAVLPPCAMNAINPPASAAASCSRGESAAVACQASSAATGTRINVCSAFQTTSKAGILSAKNSTVNSASAAAITHQFVSKCSDAGSASHRVCPSSPNVATVAYTFSPAAKLTATSKATISFGVIAIRHSIEPPASRLPADLPARRPAPSAPEAVLWPIQAERVL